MTKSYFAVFGLGLCASFYTPFAYSNGDVDAGREKSGTCVACHGLTGTSVNPMWPNLAGQHQAYLEKQIKAFRDGTRADASMQPFVANLSDQDVADLATFFANQPTCSP